MEHVNSELQDQVARSAFVQTTSVARRGAGSGPLAGLRFAVKDMFDLRGHTASCGNPDWLRTHGPAQDDAPVVAQLLSAGGSLAGVTVMDELAYSLAGDNAHYGAPINAAAPDRVTGGSSSGSAAVVAASLVDFALGTDTGGSVRVPASHCGIHGLRPAHDRIALRGVMPLSRGLDTIGWFARDARVLREVGRVLLPDPGAQDLAVREVLIADDAMAELQPTLRTRIEDAAAQWAAHLGLTLRRVIAVPMGLHDCFWAFRRVQAREVWAEHGAWIDAVRPRLGPGVRERFEAARELSARHESVEADGQLRTRLARHLGGLVAQGGVVVMPPAPGPAPLRDSATAAVEALRERTLRLTCPASLAGVPQLTVPALRLPAPMGLSFIADSEQRLLQLACDGPAAIDQAPNR